MALLASSIAPLRVAREAIIDPSVGEARPQLDGDGEGLFGPRRLAGGHPGLAISVMGLGPVGSARHASRAPPPEAPACPRAAAPR